MPELAKLFWNLHKPNGFKKGNLKFIIPLLESGHNKALKDQMVKWVGDRQDKFDVLFNPDIIWKTKLSSARSAHFSY